eukprot:CAMPEP_0119315060 /NCGR_PEP_ID=MMETSP1333-20130426/34342_1 /TAXON_ID=418940 /ORGANISM="Scyphosphaera apsteinii, Strain RCC1455" /LENGTH=311 /DNA_ID=CAMNT_0007320289 /DNA_START=52 /DNA_END=987 /DNA_ORIENTATION=+
MTIGLTTVVSAKCLAKTWLRQCSRTVILDSRFGNVRLKALKSGAGCTQRFLPGQSLKDLKLKNPDVPEAPLPPRQTTWKDFASLCAIVAFTCTSIPAICSGNLLATALLMLYENYIIVDHFPFFFTNTVYTTARINYEYTPVTLFWGAEAASSIIARRSAGAPAFVLGNVPNHVYFILANFFQVATSQYFVWGKKRMWLNVAVLFDVVCHSTNLWCYYTIVGSRLLVPLFPSCPGWAMVTALCIANFAFMFALTTWIHYDFMRLGHFLVYLNMAPTSYRQSRMYAAIFLERKKESVNAREHNPTRRTPQPA